MNKKILSKQNTIFKDAKSAFNPNVFILVFLCFGLLLAGEFLANFIYKALYRLLSSVNYITQFTVFQLIIPFLSIILVTFVWVKIIEKRSVASMGFSSQGLVNKYLRGFIIGTVLILICTILLAFLGAVKINTTNLSSATITSVFAVLIGWLVQGASEEVLLRGWLLPRIGYKHNVLLAIIVSAGFFGFLHLGNSNVAVLPMINLILYGVFASVYVIWEGGLWGICALHSAWNWAQGNIVGFEVSGITAVGGSIIDFKTVKGYDLLTGGAFGLEGGLICTFVLVIATAIIVYLNNKRAFKLNN